MAPYRRGPSKRSRYGRRRDLRSERDDREERTYAPPRSKGLVTWMILFAALGVIAAAGVLILSNGGEKQAPPAVRGVPAGEGGDGIEFCKRCGGAGRFDCDDCDRAGTNCTTCNGYGFVDCGGCYGTGR